MKLKGVNIHKLKTERIVELVNRSGSISMLDAGNDIDQTISLILQQPAGPKLVNVT